MKNAKTDQPRLFPAGDHFQVQPRFGSDSPKNVLLVLGFSKSTGSHSAHLRPKTTAERTVATERREEPIGDVPGDDSAGENLFPRADRVPFLMEHSEGPVRKWADQLQLHGLGTDT